MFPNMLETSFDGWADMLLLLLLLLLLSRRETRMHSAVRTRNAGLRKAGKVIYIYIDIHTDEDADPDDDDDDA